MRLCPYDIISLIACSGWKCIIMHLSAILLFSFFVCGIYIFMYLMGTFWFSYNFKNIYKIIRIGHFLLQIIDTDETGLTNKNIMYFSWVQKPQSSRNDVGTRCARSDLWLCFSVIILTPPFLTCWLKLVVVLGVTSRGSNFQKRRADSFSMYLFRENTPFSENHQYTLLRHLPELGHTDFLKSRICKTNRIIMNGWIQIASSAGMELYN